MTFEEWLRISPKSNGKLLSTTSVDHYNSGLSTISKEMLESHVISKPLKDMDLFELDLAILIIQSDKAFLKKDEVGNKMYSNALKRYRCFAAACLPSGKAEIQEEGKILSDNSISITEREEIVQARIGQGLYRNRLFEKFHGQCVITRLNIPQLLTASHIKPWAVCSNDDRLSKENGLLLSATYDRLFDTGLITFSDEGDIYLSNMITKENAAKLELHQGQHFEIGFTKSMGDFLQYHRDIIFVP